MRKAIDISGQRFGRWFVLERAGSQGGAATFRCKCDCGTESVVIGQSLRSGGSLSCGCLAREILGDNARKHGRHQHHLYGTWRSMRERCHSPKHAAYHRYGGRGISVCTRWNDFGAFLEDMLPSWKPGLTLDRRDNDGDYSPENCRWATMAEQARNKKVTTRQLSHNGKTQSISEWAEELGIRPAIISQRLHRGDTVERALRV